MAIIGPTVVGLCVLLLLLLLSGPFNFHIFFLLLRLSAAVHLCTDHRLFLCVSVFRGNLALGSIDRVGFLFHHMPSLLYPLFPLRRW